MIDDPIVDEIHRIREQMLAEHGGDLHALLDSIRRQTDEDVKAGKIVLATHLKPRRPTLRPVDPDEAG